MNSDDAGGATTDAPFQSEEPIAGDGGFANSCDDSKALSQCTEFDHAAMELLGVEFYKGWCELTDGNWSEARCPTAHVVGTCEEEGEVTFYYSTGDLEHDAASANEACEKKTRPWQPSDYGEQPIQVEHGDEAPCKPGGSCDHLEQDSACQDICESQIARTSETGQREICESTSGEWNTRPCPTADLVGTCAYEGGYNIHRYTTGRSPLSYDGAKAVCEDTEGTWYDPADEARTASPTGIGGRSGRNDRGTSPVARPKN